MILISAGLVLTAIILLIAGFVLAELYLVVWSIAVSMLSAVFLVIGALLRRHELFPGGRAGASKPSGPQGPVPAGPMPVPHGMPNRPPTAAHPAAAHQVAVHPAAAHHGMRPQVPVVPGRSRSGPVTGPATATTARRDSLPADAIVLVIPGRKRYHVEGCRQLAGREHEELTHEEAREEGFTPCTTCLPDPVAGTRPQDDPSGVREPAGSLTASRELRESGPADGPGEPGSARPAQRETATTRFASPYGSVTPSAGQGATGSTGSGSGSTGSTGHGSTGRTPSAARPESARSESARTESSASDSARAESPRSGFAASQARPHDSQDPGTRPGTSQRGPGSPSAGDDAPAGREQGAASRETSAARETTVFRQEGARSPQEPAVPVARPYVHSSEPQKRPQEPERAPAWAMDAPTPALPIRLPKIPEIPHAASEATSWFSRDAVTRTPAAEPENPTGPETPARPSEPEVEPEVEPEAKADAGPSATSAGSTPPTSTAPEPAVSEPTVSGPASSGSRAETPGEGRDGASERTGRESDGKDAVASTAVASTAVASTVAAETGSEPKEPEAAEPEPTRPKLARPAFTESGSATSEGGGPAKGTGEAGDEAVPATREEGPGSEGPDTASESEADGKTAPESTASQSTASESTASQSTASESPASGDAASEGVASGDATPTGDGRSSDRDDDDTSPGGIPAVKDESPSDDRKEAVDDATVMVIVGTRRFHDPACPLLKGVGDGGVESTTLGEAEKAGLSSCSVCLNDVAP